MKKYFNKLAIAASAVFVLTGGAMAEDSAIQAAITGVQTQVTAMGAPLMTAVLAILGTFLAIWAVMFAVKIIKRIAAKAA